VGCGVGLWMKDMALEFPLTEVHGVDLVVPTRRRRPRADITQCLPFADNTFDYCHIQLVLWGYQLNAFPNLLDEMIRVTKKDGWIEFVDMD
ncbi:MAG: hypothetical protein BYD32DRAFT_361656, partial [Podila humilis]